ncbi:MAG: thioredoxin family protein [Candidatus Bathyarchaeota archaeon]|nr:thioredoxin family protein [Candidatus Bathyarchaeota archaeon]
MIQIDSQKQLDEQLKENPKVLALFYASWCHYCRNFLATTDKTLNDYGFEHIIHVNIDDFDNPMWVTYNVEAVPTLIYFENGKISKRLDAESGTGLTEQRCRNWLQKIQNS